MDEITRKNYRKFRHASHCGCIECNFSKLNVKPSQDFSFFNDEDMVDEDGWF